MQSGKMKTYSDEDLAKLSRNGNREAENELVVRALPTVKFIVGTFSSPDNSVGEDDLIQEALLGVLSAIHSFNPGRGAAFMTFASRCALNRLLTFIKKTSVHNVPVVGLDIIPDIGSSESDPDEQIVADESYRKFIQSIRDTLTQTELKVLNCYLRGMSYDSISSQTGLSSKAVDNALFRARKKIKALR